LPVKNGGEYVKECVNSLLLQSYGNYNIIILDNCSTDGTGEWIKLLNSPKIIYYGADRDLTIEQNWARIKAVPKNEYMTMIGHDDLLHYSYLQQMDDLIEKHPAASLYQVHFDYIDENGKFIRDCLPMKEVQFAHEFLADQMKRQIDSTGTGYMMRSSDFDEMGGMPSDYPNLIFSDYQLWITLMLLGYKATSSKRCFSYRIHQSVSRITSGVAYQEAFFKYCAFLSDLAGKNSKVHEIIILCGRSFFYYYCEALSHRILKTPINERTIKVSDFIKACESTAKKLIPDQRFKPLCKFRIWVAKLLDQTSPGRKLFKIYRKL